MSTPTVTIHPAGIGLFVAGLSLVASSGIGTESAARIVGDGILAAAVDARGQLLNADHPWRSEIRADVTVAQMQALAPFAERGES